MNIAAMNHRGWPIKTDSGKHVIDSNGWIAYREDKAPHAAAIEPLIVDTENLLVPTIVFYEVFKYFEREYGHKDAIEVGYAMKKSRIIDLDFVLSFQAVELALDYELPMADAMILAVARAYYAPLYTLDSHLKDIPGVNYLG
ncbi:MAG: type II toxin-antitoxin system VapC family toxin [Coriobacteriia bacterium]|nr:type II toxin-antitoxin system VapC family toxin [Coriobacteriia bacterium]